MQQRCPFFEQCTFQIQNHANMPKLKNMFRVQYCFVSFEQCARYQLGLSVGCQRGPDFMLPTQNEWAQQIIQDVKAETGRRPISQTS